MSMDDTTGADTISPSLASRRTADFAGLVDRIQLLRTALPAMADDLARARREIQQLRRENTRLKKRLAGTPSLAEDFQTDEPPAGVGRR
jgi:cell shape-determining protein MreC